VGRKGLPYGKRVGGTPGMSTGLRKPDVNALAAKGCGMQPFRSASGGKCGPALCVCCGWGVDSRRCATQRQCHAGAGQHDATDGQPKPVPARCIQNQERTHRDRG
jgi:hypothetical protein